MLFWRLLYLGLFAVGTILLVISLFNQNSTYLTCIFIAWGISLVVWFVVEKLYGNFTMTKYPESHKIVDNPTKDLPIFLDF